MLTITIEFDTAKWATLYYKMATCDMGPLLYTML